MKFAGAALVALALAGPAAAEAGPRTLVVCPGESPGCGYAGGAGLQAAVAAAASGDTIAIRAGRYAPPAYTEVPDRDIIVRGFVVIERKDLTIAGEPGVVLDGAVGVPSSAIVIHEADVTLRDLAIEGFRYDVQEDVYYDGHGVFVIDGHARLERVTVSRCMKMGLTARGASEVDARQFAVLDGHVGVWIHDTAHLRLADSTISRNDSAAIAAYDEAVAHVVRSEFADNRDDGLFAENSAVLFAEDSRILRNRPFGARAQGEATIRLSGCALEGNARDATGSRGRARVLRTP